MIDLVCVLVQQRSLLGAGGELEHLLHHVHWELVPRVHRHDCPEIGDGVLKSVLLTNGSQSTY